MNSVRQAILDQTTAIDDANLSKIQDLSEIAMQELKNFDTTYENDLTERYEKIKSEMLSETVATPASELFTKVENEFFSTITEKQEEEKTPEKVVSINLRGKLIIGVFTSIVLLLSILLIYNAVLINRYKAEIGADTQIVMELETNNDLLQSQLDELLAGKTPETMDMTQLDASEINLIQRTETPTITQDTNWFDAVCNFFSGLFGG